MKKIVLNKTRFFEIEIILFYCIFNLYLWKFSTLVSICFLLSFGINIIICLMSLNKQDKLDLLVLVILSIALINILINAIINNATINFNYLEKYLMFLTTLISFLNVVKNYDILKKEAKIFRIIHFLNTLSCLDTVVAYAYFGKNMYALKGIISNFLCLNFENPNKAALFITSIVVLQYSYFIKEKKLIKKILNLLLIICNVYFVYETGSRNCLLVLLLAFIVSIKNKLKNGMSNRIILFTVSFPIIFFGAYMLLINSTMVNKYFSFMTSPGKNLDSRYTVWSEACEHINDKPFIGSYYEISDGTGMSQLHNTHVDLLASYGIVVLMLTIYYLYILLKQLKNIMEVENINNNYLKYFMVILLTGCGEAALFSGGTGINIIYMIFLLLSFKNQNEKEEKT